MGVVDGLEMIDISEQHDGTARFPLRASQFAAQEIHNHASVPN